MQIKYINTSSVEQGRIIYPTQDTSRMATARVKEEKKQR